jgi:hypothetical protein
MRQQNEEADEEASKVPEFHSVPLGGAPVNFRNKTYNLFGMMKCSTPKSGDIVLSPNCLNTCMHCVRKSDVEI